MINVTMKKSHTTTSFHDVVSDACPNDQDDENHEDDNGNFAWLIEC